MVISHYIVKSLERGQIHPLESVFLRTLRIPDTALIAHAAASARDAGGS
jgi:hypothetical protein